MNPKGVPKKIKISNLKYVFCQKSKFQIWSNWAQILYGLVGPLYELFLFSGPYCFRPFYPRYGCFQVKNGHILEMKPQQKNCHCAKELQNVFLHDFRWSKNFFIFFVKIFFWTPLRNFFFSKGKKFIFWYPFWFIIVFDPKNGP